jgi:hypothetical protein
MYSSQLLLEMLEMLRALHRHDLRAPGDLHWLKHLLRQAGVPIPAAHR